MWRRVLIVLALAFVAGTIEASPSLAKSPFTGEAPVHVDGYRLVPGSDAATGFANGSVIWAIVDVDISNIYSYAFVPQIGSFYLTLPNGGAHVQGADSGAGPLLGIKNSHDPLQPGKKRRYTVGFRTEQSQPSGIISYEP